MKKSPYNAGRRIGISIFKNNIQAYGKRGVDRSYAAMKTCQRYSKDKSITKTKDGKILTHDLRRVYEGMADGLYTAYDKDLTVKKYAKRNKHKRYTLKKKSAKKKTNPVYDYSTFFDFDKRGNIKGSYNADGFFEPD